ncbi:hypothetical protein [Streptomyces niveus]|uniref:hypothetical protein n=1 Tax=Streptomyces niveus TaxID=193462 RepID=UPI00343A2726
MPNGVLRNKLGITDHQLLATAEADITRARLVMLAERPLHGAYDLDHLQAFHASVFGDIYPWAGELRTVNIAKRTASGGAADSRAAYRARGGCHAKAYWAGGR